MWRYRKEGSRSDSHPSNEIRENFMVRRTSVKPSKELLREEKKEPTLEELLVELTRGSDFDWGRLDDRRQQRD
jgi:hypothetical protein